jgi:hypothetical protein
MNLIGESQHFDTLQRGKEVGEGVGVIRVKHAADGELLQRTFYDERSVGISVEFGGDLAEGSPGEDDLSLHPGFRLAGVGWRGGDRDYAVLDQRLLPTLEAQAAVRLQAAGRFQRAFPGGYRDDSLNDRDSGCTTLAIHIELGAEREELDLTCRNAKGAAGIPCNFEQGLTAIEVQAALAIGIANGYGAVTIEVQD